MQLNPKLVKFYDGFIFSKLYYGLELVLLLLSAWFSLAIMYVLSASEILGRYSSLLFAFGFDLSSNFTMIAIVMLILFLSSYLYKNVYLSALAGINYVILIPFNFIAAAYRSSELSSVANNSNLGIALEVLLILWWPICIGIALATRKYKTKISAWRLL